MPAKKSSGFQTYGGTVRIEGDGGVGAKLFDKACLDLIEENSVRAREDMHHILTCESTGCDHPAHPDPNATPTCGECGRPFDTDEE